MSIKTEKRVVVDGEDYRIIANALDLARRYIQKTPGPKTWHKRVDEFDEREVSEMLSTMDKYWD